jgi:hypothetical protein
MDWWPRLRFGFGCLTFGPFRLPVSEPNQFW